MGIFIITSCSNSEYSLDNLVPGKYHKVVYFKDSGKKDLLLYTTQTNYKDSLIIIKAGSNPSLSADMNVNVMAQSAVDSIYSIVDGINYKIIPQYAYTFDSGQEVAFGKNETGKYLSLTINPIKIYEQIKANPDVKYVLPLQLISKKDNINVDLDKSLLIFDVKSPIVSFQNENQNEIMIYKTLDVIDTLNLNNCDNNKWNFTCTLDDGQNDKLVAEYNTYHNTSYESLPQGSYKISGLDFKEGSLKAVPKVSIDRSYLQDDHTYILPLKLSQTSMGEQMEVSSTPAYLIISNPKYGIVQPDRSKWKVLFCNNDNKMSGSDWDNDGVYAILDGNLNTYWHSNYSSPIASSDDYDYGFDDYYAFLDSRNANQTAIVLDMQTTKHLIGVGITQRQNTSYRDFKSCDIYVSNDAAFKFKPINSGGTFADYSAVASNSWSKLCSVVVPQQDATYWQEMDLPSILNGGVKGRFVKIQFTGSYRGNVLNMTEFQVLELLSIEGNPVE